MPNVSTIRGVPFYLEAHSLEAARDAIVHAFTSSEGSFVVQDQGGTPSTLVLDAYCIGASFSEQRASLERALYQPGPATLYLAGRGELRGYVTGSISVREAPRRGRADIKFQFTLAPAELSLDADDPTVFIPFAAAAARLSAAQAFAAKMSNYSTAPVAMEQASAALGDAVMLTRVLGRTARAPLQSSQLLRAQVDQLGLAIGDLLAAPADAITELQAWSARVMGGGAAVTRGLPLQSARTLAEHTDQIARFGAATIPDTHRHEGQDADPVAVVVGAVRATLIAHAIELLAAAHVDSVQAALAIRDTVYRSCGLIIETSDDAVASELRTLRAAFVRAMTEQAAALPDLRLYKVGAFPMPALAIAHEVYGDAHRTRELLDRNDLSDPLFIESGTLLEVLP